jgi:cell fate regulator YaaT (PSP1 superfamily)
MTEIPVSEETSVSPPIRVAGVRFQPTGRLYSFDIDGCEDLRVGDVVLVETARGQQLGEVATLRPMRPGEQGRNLSPVLRRATGRDLALRSQWQDKAQEALSTAEKLAAEMRIPLKLSSAEYTFDGRQLTLLYVGDEKDKKHSLDWLAQRLQRTLSVQVELRRIGPRDHAKLLGGYGACGEPCCCSRFLAEFNPVSIKMAKTQGVSLNPSEITGVCGRLRCCLAYEEGQYLEACEALPRRKERVMTPYGEGKVVDLLPLQGVVVVMVEDRRVDVPVEQVTRLS